jgi:hypothetical protein
VNARGGARWPPDEPVVLSAGAAAGEEHAPPSLAVGPEGVWTAWQAYRAGRERILARCCAPDGTLGPLEQVTARAGRHATPSLVLAGGRPLVVWQTAGRGGAPGQAVWARRTASRAARWTAPAPISCQGRTAHRAG